jgi:membrane peptidoglycan carboxypeptidase
VTSEVPLRLPTGKRVAIGGLLAMAILLAGLILREFYTSQIQSLYFASVAEKLKFAVERGPSDKVVFPDNGPFDQRLGYSLIPSITERVTKRGYEVKAQSRLSPEHLSLVKKGLIYPIYKEKSQAGLNILDTKAQPLFSAQYPQLIYRDFDEIPPAIVGTLLMIENRELLAAKYPYKNPTLDWSRLFVAIFDNIVNRFVASHESPGGSTLATQLEKYRHSPEGRTVSAKQKLVQMISASFRAYQDGRNTTEARRRIITDYINSVPLGAIPGAGEIRGIGHALAAWHGASFSEVNELLRDVKAKESNPERLKAKALAYKQVLSLFLAQRRPAYYLVQDHDALKVLVDKHIDVMIKGKVIPKRLRRLVTKAELTFRNNNVIFQPERLNFVERKAANAVRVHLMNYFGFDRLYTLDRLDLRVNSTIDYDTQKAVQELLVKLKNKDVAQANGLVDTRLLAQGDPADVIYSFTLREWRQNANLLRVQTDNVDGPFNVSEGGKLELGSTAKLRTLVTYLEIIEELWVRYRRLSVSELRQQESKIGRSDHLSAWAVEWLQHGHADGKATLSEMLEAALNRTYSANPGERFLTGGGIHRFNNFDKSDNSRTVTVHEAVRRSINLPFVRIMRDVVSYFMGQIPNGNAMLTDINNPERQQYLMRFANKEGREFLGRFFLRYRGLSSDDMLLTLLKQGRKTPKRLAVIHSMLYPDAQIQHLRAFIDRNLPGTGLKDRQLKKLYADMRDPKLTLQDRGYISGLHPLELWLVAYLFRAPKVSFTQIVQASTGARQDAYKWLFNVKGKNRQDSRIRIMLEEEAFHQIREHWAKVGYPFATLVPTYATALGSSGDKPTALADLMGIVLSGGVQYANTRVTGMDFGVGTPFETQFRAKPSFGTRVLSTDIANAVRDAIRQVVDSGTAVRVKGSFLGPDHKPLQVGGKTGTGDNRYSVFAPGGRIIESRAVSRTATFVFYIGERFYGTITAYVPDAAASKFSFTSALPVQILKVLAPKLMPLINSTLTPEP